MIFELNLELASPEEGQDTLKQYLIAIRKSIGASYSGLDYLAKIKGLPGGKLFNYEKKNTGVVISTIFDFCELYGLTFLIYDNTGCVFEYPDNSQLELFMREKRLKLLGAAIKLSRCKLSGASVARMAKINPYSLILIERGEVGVKMMNFFMLGKALKWKIEIKPIKK